MSSIIRETLEKGIVVLSLNRPEKRNALNLELMDELTSLVSTLENDPSQRIIILKGEGKVFCAGLDLEQARDREKAELSANAVAGMLTTIHGTCLITIAAVHGAAFAGGGGLAAACDIVIAEEGASFGFPEVRRGLVAAQVAALLAGQMSLRHLKELLLLGKEISALRALEIGLINRVVKEGCLMAEAQTFAKEVLLGAPGALFKTKKLLEKFSPSPFLESLDFAIELHNEAKVSEEASEGIEAFFQKRAPKWVL